MIRSSVNGEDPTCAYLSPFSWQLRSDIPLFSTCIRSHQIRTLWGFQKQVLSSSQSFCFFMCRPVKYADSLFLLPLYGLKSRFVNKIKGKVRTILLIVWSRQKESCSRELRPTQKRNWVYRVFHFSYTPLLSLCKPIYMILFAISVIFQCYVNKFYCFLLS